MFADFDWIGTLSGSPTMIALLGCSIVTMGVALERVLYFRQRREDADAVLARASAQVRQGQAGEAAGTCQASRHPFGAVAIEVLRSPDPRGSEVEERMQVALSRQKLLLERNLITLGTMAAGAPLIGLLGTVWGIMRAFHDMAQTGSAAPSVVAAGVAEALMTTAAGLVIAIPSLMIYNHLTRQVNVMLTVAENNARSLRTQLVAHPAAGRPARRGGGAGRDAGRDGRLEGLVEGLTGLPEEDALAPEPAGLV